MLSILGRNGYALLLLIGVSIVGRANHHPDSLEVSDFYGKEARIVSYILDNNHFSELKLDDSLSAAILDRYILSLDPTKLYFLKADIADFNQYKHAVDDYVRQEKVSFAFDIFKVYVQRFKERHAYLMDTLVQYNYDLTIDEFYETDRDEATWSYNREELNDIWRKVLKSQVLRDVLNDKPVEEIREDITKRYQRFYKSFSQINAEDVFGIFMNAYAESYDPHTNYLTPTATDRFNQNMSLSLEGIGARLMLDNDFTKIVDVVHGGPADKSKAIFPDDLILAVAQGEDGEFVNVLGWRLDDVVKLIKGPKGTTVRLQIQSAKDGLNGVPNEITLVREKIKLEDRKASKKIISYDDAGEQKKLGVITLPGFYMDFEAYNRGDKDYTSTSRDVRKLLKELNEEQVSGVVMDLRDNGGGSLKEAVALTGLFIKEGPVVQVKNSASKVEVIPDPVGDVAYDGPLVVLTNRRSASASEIFAGAIQDYHRGVVVGESTFGKGTVQTVLDLNRFVRDDVVLGSLKFTYQKFYRISGSSTQNKGIIPDVKLPTPLKPYQFGERSMPNALPWDLIESTQYQVQNNIDANTVTALNIAFNQRMKDDHSLIDFVSKTEDRRRILADTKISLNEAYRRAKLADSKNDDVASLPDTNQQEGIVFSVEGDEIDDAYLREGMFVLLELSQKGSG